MADDRRQTTIRFEPELLCKIAYVAKQNKRSLNAQLEYLAQKCVDEYEKENGEILIPESELYSK
ncbi:MAG: Arc family DNA-binding protein [Oscillospiraceae bacterium]|nr:Arc family DNA-binding protein [Oscillospiraceae bacterium]